MRIRAFVSYSTKNKPTAERVADALKALGVSTFVAHRDIKIGKWEPRIRTELNRCDLFVPVITKAFWESEWAPQEVGAAATRSGCLPFAILTRGQRQRGFLKSFQFKRSTILGIGPELFIEPLMQGLPRQAGPGVVRWVTRARSPGEVEERLTELRPAFSHLDKQATLKLAQFLARSTHVRRSERCRRRIVPAFVRSRRSLLPAKLRQDLEDL